MGNFLPKFWFTSETPLPCFGSDFGPLHPPLVTYNSTRKQFFAKLLGVVGTASVLPALSAKSALAASNPPLGSKVTASKIKIAHDTRAIARRDVV